MTTGRQLRRMHRTAMKRTGALRRLTFDKPLRHVWYKTPEYTALKPWLQTRPLLRDLPTQKWLERKRNRPVV